MISRGSTWHESRLVWEGRSGREREMKKSNNNTVLAEIHLFEKCHNKTWNVFITKIIIVLKKVITYITPFSSHTCELPTGILGLSILKFISISIITTMCRPTHTCLHSHGHMNDLWSWESIQLHCLFCTTLLCAYVSNCIEFSIVFETSLNCPTHVPFSPQMLGL